MKRMTKWLAVCAACMAFSVPAMAAEMPGVTVTPTPVETPDITPIETPTPTQKPQVKNGWYTYASKNKRYYKDGQYLTGMRKVQGKIYYFSPKGFMKTGWIKYNNKKYYYMISFQSDLEIPSVGHYKVPTLMIVKYSDKNDMNNVKEMFENMKSWMLKAE